MARAAHPIAAIVLHGPGEAEVLDPGENRLASGRPLAEGGCRSIVGLCQIVGECLSLLVKIEEDSKVLEDSRTVQWACRQHSRHRRQEQQSKTPLQGTRPIPES